VSNPKSAEKPPRNAWGPSWVPAGYRRVTRGKVRVGDLVGMWRMSGWRWHARVLCNLGDNIAREYSLKWRVARKVARRGGRKGAK